MEDKYKFWDQRHMTNDTYWLTGSSPTQVIEMHALKNNISDCVTFLDIGIGKGNMSRYMNSLGKTVYACDISKVALEKVKSYVSETALTSDLSKLPPSDLAICHLVFQHCDDTMITNIINAVNLSKDGIFSFQFACLRPNEYPNENVQKLLDMKTHYLRSLDDVKSIIEKSNKKLIYHSEPMDFYHSENLRWYFCQVTNKEL